MALGTPDLSEAQSLERHVDRCAMRYRMFSKRLISQGKAVRRVELIVYVLLAWTLLTSEPARNVFKIIISAL